MTEPSDSLPPVPTEQPNENVLEEEIVIDSPHGGFDGHFNPAERINTRTRIDSDTGRFLREFYRYYDEKGFYCVLLKKISNISIPISINIFTFIILNHINLMGMLYCKGEECANIPIIINLGFFFNYSWTNYLVILWCLGVFGYIGVLCYLSWNFLFRMWKMKKFVNVDLGVDEDTLKTLTWGEMVERLIQKNKEYDIFRSDDVDALDIVNYIMRLDNFIVALEHMSILDLKLPLLNEPILPEIAIRNLRWALRDTLNSQDLSKRINMPSAATFLQQRFFFYGILNLLLSPFIILYILIKVFFKYFAEFHKNKTFFFNRTWSTRSLWQFRSYNELPHEFKRRISKSHFYADLYVNQFPSPLFSVLGKNVMFFASAGTAIILALTTFKNPLLIHMSFLGQNLLWWSVVLLTVFGIASGLVIGKYDVFKPQKYLNKVGKYTHFLPEDWKKRAKDPEILSEFQGKYYQMKVKWFLIELLSIFITPYFLIFRFPKSARIMVEFIRASREKTGRGRAVTDFLVGGIVCGFSTFQLEDFGDFQLIVDEHGAIGSRRRNVMEMRKDGKLAKSYLLFKANHPSWKERRSLGTHTKVMIQALLHLRDERKEKKDRELLEQSRRFTKKDFESEDLLRFESTDEDLGEGAGEVKKKMKRRFKKRKRESVKDLNYDILNTYIKESGTGLKRSMDNFSGLASMREEEKKKGEGNGETESQEKNVESVVIRGSEDESDNEAYSVMQNLDPQVEDQEAQDPELWKDMK